MSGGCETGVWLRVGMVLKRRGRRVFYLVSWYKGRLGCGDRVKNSSGAMMLTR